jgi:cell division protein FtsZ
MAKPPSNPKRASMREGPLAELFRQSEEANTETPGASAEGAEAQQSGDGQPSAPEPPAEEPRTSAQSPARERPSASGSHADEQQIPSPRQRLRDAFSPEIPENMTDRRGGVADPLRSPNEVSPVPVGARAAESIDGAQAPASTKPVLRVVGIGGAGVNAVNRMVEVEIEGVEFLAINTDLQSLQQSSANVKLHIGEEVTGGLGSGSDAEVGRQAAVEEYDRIKALLKGSDMIFVTAGVGGGTGTGAAPVVARIAREVGALTVAIVTKPFAFEGSRRTAQGEQGVRALAGEVDTLIVVPNDRLLSALDRQTTMVEAFRVADDVLRQGVQGISDLVTLPGLINLDFADVRTIMSAAGSALLGIGMGVGETRATDAANQAVSSPLLEISMDGAHSILLSITGGNDLSLWEVNDAARAISEAAHADANIIFGAMVDEKLEDQVWVTVIATGYSGSRRSARHELRTPAGEPQPPLTGATRSRGSVRQRGDALSVGELQVPEFVPR